MARKRHTPEQVVNLLRQVEVGIANGRRRVRASRKRCDEFVSSGRLGKLELIQALPHMRERCERLAI
jgi:hypothetical protein